MGRDTVATMAVMAALLMLSPAMATTVATPAAMAATKVATAALPRLSLATDTTAVATAATPVATTAATTRCRNFLELLFTKPNPRPRKHFDKVTPLPDDATGDSQCDTAPLSHLHCCSGVIRTIN